MSDKELLNDWLVKLYASLKGKNEEIEELESKMTFRKKLNELHLDRLGKWLKGTDLDEDVRGELEYSKEYVKKMPDEFEKELAYLNKSKKATLFMINKIEKELRD